MIVRSAVVDATRLDRDTYDQVAETVGTEVMARMLAGLAGELRKRLGEDGSMPDRERLAFDAHALVSGLGSLGFTMIAERCRALETACKSGADYADTLVEVHGLRRSTLAQIEILRAA